MYNLLIVDDEPLITDSLCDLFSTGTEAEFNVIKAYSGAEALEWVEKARIDILLTDISMPGVSGFDVHRQTARLWPECLAIYLTSFDEFEYVQQAIRREGMDYILKTEGDAAVIKAVDRAVARIGERNRDRLLLEQAKDSLSQALPLLQARFVSDLADGILPEREGLDEQLLNLRIPLQADLPVLIVVGQAADSQPMAAADRIRQVYKARNLMESFFEGIVTQICTVHERNRLIMLMQPAPADSLNADLQELFRSLAIRVSGSLDRLQALCGESCGLSLSFAASAHPVTWEDVGTAYYTLRMRLRKGAEALYIESSTELEQQAASAYHETRMQISRLSLLKSRLEAGDRDGFMALYDGVMASAGIQDASPYEIRAEIYYRIASMLIEYVNRQGGGDAGERRPDIEKLFNMQGHHSWEEAVSFFKGVANRLFESQQNETQRNESYIYTYIRDYTCKHISEDLSLTRFATLLSFHPFYLSKLFKKISGKTLSEYVSGVKLEKAKKMLSERNTKVSDISSSLGFMTSSYFISFFRKHTGLSPLEYRSSRNRTGS